ncbi:MAG: arylsulfatase A-like enzyme [Planctomycetota bacterium]|jgi:arylsulfatase A-like enzyme
MKRYLGIFIAGFLATTVLWIVELTRLLKGQALNEQRLVIFDGPAQSFAHQLLIPALLVCASFMVATSLRQLVRDRVTWRRLVVPILALPISIWLGIEISVGGSIQRAGLSTTVVLATPILVAAILYIAIRILEKLAQGWTRSTAVLLVFAVIVIGYANRTMLVGRYRPIHDFLALFEIVALAAAIFHLFWSPIPKNRRVLLSSFMFILGAGLFVRTLSSWPISPLPSESLRQVFGHDGFHSERLLYWRTKLQSIDDSDGNDDQDLLQSIANWNDLANHFQNTLDVSLPDRRAFNFLWISIDTLRPDRLGCYGSKKGLTPTIDAIAKEGTVFADAYAQYPSTNLSSESMFFGRYPRATAIYRDIKGDLSSEDMRTLRISALAQQNGMKTAASVAFTEEWMQSPLFVRALGDYESVNDGRTGSPSLDGEHFANSAIKTIDRLASKRFFLWFHLFDPHHPYEFRENYGTSKGAEGRYESEIRYADAQVARVVKKLKDKGLWDKTIVVINSDHGEAFGEHGLKYHGSSLHEAQIRVPLIIRVPGLPPSRPNVIAENVDIYATLSSLLALDGSSANQGTDLTPLIAEPGVHEKDFPNFAYAELPDDVKELSPSATRTAIYREGRWKIKRQLLLNYTELYDLEADPWEKRNVAKERPLIAKRMGRRLRTLGRWTDGFGRQKTSREIRHGKIQTARTQLNSPSPVAVGDGLKYAAKHDLFELRKTIFGFAEKQDVASELRCEALTMSARWNAAGWRDLAQTWMFSDSPILRWVALDLIFDDLALRNQAGKMKWEPHVVRKLAEQAKVLGRGQTAEALLARVFVALTVRTASVRVRDADVATDWRSLLKSRYVSPTMKRRVVLAYMDQIDNLESHLGFFEESRIQRNFLGEIWRSGHHKQWLQIVRVLIPDRYLGEPIKHDILRHCLDQFSDEVLSEVGLFFLARWDPGFQVEVVEKLTARLGQGKVERLQKANSHESDGDELLVSGHADGAIQSYDKALELLSGLPVARRIAVKRIEALLLSGDNKKAEASLSALGPAQSKFPLEKVERRIKVLTSYRPTQGLLPETASIQVTGVQVEEAAKNFVVLDGDFSIRVNLKNSSPRSLPGGNWGLGGRLRVLWSRDGATNWVYGTQVDLEEGLLPGESGEQEIKVNALDEKGIWHGRIIVNQQGGARFHTVEDVLSTFTVHVVRSVEGPVNHTWLPVEMAKHFEFDERLRDPMVFPPDTSLAIVALGYEAAFRTPALAFDGGERKLKIDFTWTSAIDGANLIRIDVLPTASFAPVAPIILNIPWDGRSQTVETNLPACAGLYHVELRVGYRQGDLKIHSLKID